VSTLTVHLPDGRRFPVRAVPEMPIERLHRLLEPLHGPSARLLDYVPADDELAHTVDIALLKIVLHADTPPLPYLPLVSANPVVGEPVVGQGYPFNPESAQTPLLTATGGPVLPFAPDNYQGGIPKRPWTSTPTQLWFLGLNSNGFSGGPIINGNESSLSPSPTPTRCPPAAASADPTPPASSPPTPAFQLSGSRPTTYRKSTSVSTDRDS
jgi:hypothetical protein